MRTLKIMKLSEKEMMNDRPYLSGLSEAKP